MSEQSPAGDTPPAGTPATTTRIDASNTGRGPGDGSRGDRGDSRFGQGPSSSSPKGFRGMTSYIGGILRLQRGNVTNKIDVDTFLATYRKIYCIEATCVLAQHNCNNPYLRYFHLCFLCIA